MGQKSLHKNSSDHEPVQSTMPIPAQWFHPRLIPVTGLTRQQTIRDTRYL